MRRRSLALGAAGLLIAVVGMAAPASAQCSTNCPDPTTTSSTTTSSTSTSSTTSTTVLSTTSTTDAPPPTAVTATTTNDTPKPGEAVPIVAPPPSGTTPAIDTTKPIAAVMVNTNPDKPDVPMPAPVITVNPNGTQTISVTVPANTPDGIYVIAVVGTAPNGSARVIIVPVVVRRNPAPTTTAATASAAAAPTSSAVRVPASVRRVAASIGKIGGEAAVTDAVFHDGATLKIDNDQLVLYRPGASSNDDSRPLVAAFAVALAGGGLVLLRRRTPAISKRSR